ncbi:hypothetical protein BGZ65_012414, partial [Modicella reniformis]
MATAAPILTSQDRILSLASPQDMDMGGISLSSNAIPVTMTGVAYILDKASDGSTVLYSINPSQGAKLQRVDVQGDVPLFSTFMTATVLNSQIVVYTPAKFNSFDTIKAAWTGPDLVKSWKPPNGRNNPPDGSKTPLAAIIGGVVGGLVIIAIIVILVIRHRRKSSDRTVNHAYGTAPAEQ